MVPSAQTPTSDESTRRAVSILVIDGNEEHQAFSVRALGRRGFHVIAADGLNEGLRLVGAEPCDVVVLAYKLRGISGLNALKALLRQLRGVPVIFLVPEGSEDIAMQARELGASGCLVKTAGYHELLSAEVEDQLSKASVGRRLQRQQQALEETAARYREAVETRTAPILVVDSSGNLVESNAAMSALTGYSETELAHVRLSDLLPEWGEGGAARFIETVRERPAGEVEFRLRRKDGAELFVELTARAVHREGGARGVEILARDVTERKRSENELQDLYGWLEALYEATNDAVLLADRDLRVVRWNTQAVRLFKIAPEAMAYRPVEEWLRLLAERAKDSDSILQTLANLQRHPETVADGPLELLSPERRVYWRQSLPVRNREGTVIGRLWTFGDITERLEASEALRRRDAILDAIRYSAEQFLKVNRWEDAIQAVVPRLGEATGVSRVWIFQNQRREDGILVTRSAYEWEAPGVSSQRDPPDRPSRAYTEHGFERWEKLLGRGEVIVGHTREFPASERASLEAQQIRSIAVVPIFVGSRWWGSIGFDQCDAERDWSSPEVDALETAAGTLSSAIMRSETTEILRAVVLSSPSAVVALDLNGNLTLWNEAAVEMFGWRPEEVLGRPLPTVPPEKKLEHLEMHRRASRGEATADVETRRVRKDGSFVDVRISVAPIFDAARRVTGTMGVLTDITERRRAEKVQEAIYRISEAANSAESLEQLYPEIHRIVSELMPAKNFYIALHDVATDTLNFAYFVDEHEDPPPPQRLKRGLTEYVLRTAKPLLASPEVFDNLLRKGDVVLVGPYSIDWLGVPLVAADKPIGVLVVQSYTEGVRYSEADMNILVYVSNQVAMAIERRRGEDALRESEARFRRVAQNAEDVIYRYRLTDPVGLEYVSSAMTRVGGYTPEELCANPDMAFKIVHPEDLPILQAALRSPEVLRQPLTLRWIRKDGAVILTEQRNVPIYDREGNFVAVEGIARNITERKEAEAALRESEERYRLLFENNPQPMLVFDSESLEFLAVNEAAIQHYGYSREEFLSMTIKEIRPPEDVPALLELLDGLPPGMSRVGGWRHRKKDGTIIDVDIVAHDVKFGERSARLVLVNDVTARKRAEEELASSERKFRTLIESAVDGIVLIDHEAMILDVNPAGEEILGASRATLVGKNMGDILPLEAAERARDYLRSTLRAKVGIGRFPLEIRTADGRRRSLEVRSQAVREPGREPYVEMVFRDVTEQLEMQRRLLESERLASIGSMAGYVAHEINNPLANISLLVASAGRKTKDPELLEKLERINRQRRQAANIISDILSFSKQREIQVVQSNLSAIIEAAIEQVAPYRKKGVAVQTHLPDGSISVEVDPLQMQEVLVNLLKNALEATSSGSVTVEVVESGDSIEVRVADTGSGIPSEISERLFEPFFTTKKKTGGTGLGLALCRNVVTAHGGEIRVSSEVGKGSTFTVLIPRRQHPREVSG
jgi:PAS domain S-box-containing protein